MMNRDAEMESGEKIVKLGIGFPFAGLCDGELVITKIWTKESDGETILELALKSDQGKNLRDLLDNGNKLIFLDPLLSLNLDLKEFRFYYNLNKKNISLKINDSPLPIQVEEFSKEKPASLETPPAFSKEKGSDDKPSGKSSSPFFALPTIWLPMKRTIGPLDIKRVGLNLDLQNGIVWIPIDAALSLSSLSFGLNDFELGVPFSKEKSFDIRLGGLSLAFRNGPVEIGGGFLKVKDSSEYFGEALIKIKNFSLSAMGSYSSTAEPSLFVFALVSYPIGGPPCFYVTGLAAGFGYNRTLKIPEVDDLANFPLVSYATSNEKPSFAEITEGMSEYIHPSAGDFWLAAGVKFTSFNMINSFALLTVKFGTKLEVALLGRSIMNVPSEGAPSSSGFLKAAHAELLIKVKFDPENGVIAATGILGPNSYILSKDCRLTGGFAFYTWFKGDKKGDFVLSLGGYHPAFKRPDHYPIVPRLALNWPVSDSLYIKGSGYFALTPSCAMAGGALEAVYQEGNLKAWFAVHADFFFEWKPFHYDINAGINIGVSYLAEVWGIKKLFTFELGASAHLWGPEFSGEVHIKWTIFSFTVKFGQGRSNPQWLDWDEFSQSFLPKDNSGKVQPINVMIARGLLKEVNNMWMVNPFDFSIIINSSIPCTSIKFNGDEIPCAIRREFFIRPMGEARFKSCVEVTIKDLKGNYLQGKFCPSATKENLPKAIWISCKSSTDAEMIEEFPVGLQFKLIKPDHNNAIKIKNQPNQIEKEIIQWVDVPCLSYKSFSEDTAEEYEEYEYALLGSYIDLGSQSGKFGENIKEKYALLEQAVIALGPNGEK
jgi:hypothetical protein